jgi:hypothetical protein
MSHFAEIDADNKVIRVLVGDNNEPDEGLTFMQSLGGNWIKTSYNNNIRFNYAGIGYSYDEMRDAFIAPEPEGNLGFDEATCQWIMPALEYSTPIISSNE